MHYEQRFAPTCINPLSVLKIIGIVTHPISAVWEEFCIFSCLLSGNNYLCNVNHLLFIFKQKIMKKFLTICALVSVALSFTGCVGFSTMTANNHNLTQTQVVLSENNFQVVGQAYGEATATYICGLCAVSKKALRNNAINEMTKNANLTGSQTLTNVTVSSSIHMITPFWMQLTYSATANVVEFTK